MAATLSREGTEIARFERTALVEGHEYRSTLSLRSNGSLMRKDEFRDPNPVYLLGGTYQHPWKGSGWDREASVDPEQWLSTMRAQVADGRTGWREMSVRKSRRTPGRV